jgi:hypothetical protein
LNVLTLLEVIAHPLDLVTPLVIELSCKQFSMVFEMGFIEFASLFFALLLFSMFKVNVKSVVYALASIATT